MEFNKLVSLVLGFIILILVFVWISNRFRASTRTAQNRTPTITPTHTPTPSIAEGEKTVFGGWNPLSFLNRDTDNTPTPVARQTSPTPTVVRESEVTATVVPTKAAGPIVQNQKNSPTAVPNQPTTKPEYTNSKANESKTLTQIPETGASSVLLPLMLAGLTTGIYLRRRI